MKLYKNLSNALKERDEVRAIKLSLKGKYFPVDLFELPYLEEAYLARGRAVAYGAILIIAYQAADILIGEAHGT